jgi:hypothetical protein
MGDDIRFSRDEISLPTCPKDSSPEIKNLYFTSGGKAKFATSSSQKVQGKWMSSLTENWIKFIVFPLKWLVTTYGINQ